MKAANYCVFLPRLDAYRFASAMGQCDIVLDSIGWSGCNSTLESLQHDLLVTMMGPLMRGRHTTAILKMMDVDDTITESIDDYVSTAVRLARDVPWRMAVKSRIAENKHRVYRDTSCVSALGDFLNSAVHHETEAPSIRNDPVVLSSLLSQAVAFQQKRYLLQAENLYLQILAAQPDHFDAQHLLGALRHQQGRNEEALTLIEAALKIRPDTVEALSNQGAVLDALGRHEAALASYERALTIRPNDVDALYNRANTLKDLQRHAQALVSYDQALAAKPEFPEALYNRGNALTELKRPMDALASYDRALAIRPDYVKALFNRGNVLIDLKRPEEARQSFEKVIALDPDHPFAFGQFAALALETCDFPHAAEFMGKLEAQVLGGKSILHPFLLIRYCDDHALQLAAAQRFLHHTFPVMPQSFRHDARAGTTESGLPTCRQISAAIRWLRSSSSSSSCTTARVSSFSAFRSAMTTVRTSADASYRPSTGSTTCAICRMTRPPRPCVRSISIS
jgi:tetratricopeptide (TPR) repeat protein